jgi:hypothetical protein
LPGTNIDRGPAPDRDDINRQPITGRDQVFDRDGDRNRGDRDDRDRGDRDRGDRDRGDRDWDRGRDHDHDHDRDDFRWRRYFFRPGFGWWYWRWNPLIGRYYQYYDRSYVGGSYPSYAYGYESAPPAPQAVLGVTFDANLSGGAYITQVVAGSAAEQAGLVPGDVIVGIYGGPISSYQEVVSLVAQSRPGDAMQLEVLRGGQRFSAEAVLGAAQ